MSPKHIDKITDPQRIAIAPYNFVELPEKVVEAEDLPSGDRYHLERHTGRIECTLTTESPLYIRCGLTTEEFQAGKEAKDLLDFFYTDPATKSAKPVLPGSSLRGMLRTLVEIVSFSKIDKVSGHQRLFFRAVASNPEKESWGGEYKTYVDPKKIQAGYLRKDNLSWYIQLATKIKGVTFAWVQQSTLNLQGLKLMSFDDPLYEPQYTEISYSEVEKNNQDKAKRIFAHNVELPAIYPNRQGILVTSGNMKQVKQGDKSSPRHNHCIVFAEDKKASRLEIDNKAIEHYRNALTDFQKGSPFDNNWGVLEENRPVFYLPPKNGSKVGFFGQSPNFRIPYSPEGDGHATTVVDFIPKKLRNLATIDLADAIFGWVKKESEEENLPKGFDKQRAGRVFVTDALYQIAQNSIWYEKAPLIPQILSESKPTCFPHYLVQPEENNPNADPLKLKHYASQSVTETVIRGHKLYWHKGSDPNFKLAPPKKVIGSPKKVSDTQTTLIKPINRGVVFKFDIHFENLSQVELGALLWVLSLGSEKSQTLKTGKPGEKYCFSLGMGKPLGMGAVKIDHELHLSDRKERYENLFHNNEWKTGEEDQAETAQKEEKCVMAFEKYILDSICCQDYPKDTSREQLQHLKQLPRIEMLLAMLQCDKTPDVDHIRYMELEDFKNRKVLPTPLDIMKIPDNRRRNNLSPSPSISGGADGNSSSSGNTPKPKLKGSDKNQPIKKSLQSQQQWKPKDNSEGSNSAALTRPPKPKS